MVGGEGEEKTMKPEDRPGLAFVSGMMLMTLILVISYALIELYERGHKGGVCYPNKTCNFGLECWSADGLSPTCVRSRP